ncbi:MAG: hypothetical protein V1674_03635 [Candidatus Omnitrophota bacterium]
MKRQYIWIIAIVAIVTLASWGMFMNLFLDRKIAQFANLLESLTGLKANEQFTFSVDRDEFLRGRPRLKKMNIKLSKLLVIQKENGEFDIKSLEDDLNKLPKMSIDELRLQVEKVTFIKYGKGKVPSVKEFDVNINKRYLAVENPVSLVNIILFGSLPGTTIQQDTGLDPGDLPGGDVPGENIPPGGDEPPGGGDEPPGGHSFKDRC